MKKQKKGYSVKPGRMRSAQSAAGGIFAVVFGIIWIIAAVSMGAPWFFPLFGIVFIATAGYNTYISYKNATGDNRYSEFDIVDINSEPDPWDEKFRNGSEFYTVNESGSPIGAADAAHSRTNFCPYCGTAAEADFEFCKSCGKKLPD